MLFFVVSSQQPYPDSPNIGATIRSIQEEQASLWAYVASEHAALRDFVKSGMMGSEG